MRNTRTTPSTQTSTTPRAAGYHPRLGAILLLGAAMFTTALAGPGSRTFTVNWFSVDSGGGIPMTDGALIEITGTAGQPDAGTMFSLNGDIEIVGGFGAATASGQMNWSGGTSGSFTQPSFWDEGVAPVSHDTVIFDFAAPLIAISMPTDNTIGRLFVLDSIVRMDFNNTDLFLIDESPSVASLVIGRKTGLTFPAELRVQNLGNAPHGLETKSVSIGDFTGSSGALRISGANARFKNTGDLWVGRRSPGVMEISNGAQATSLGRTTLASFTSASPLDGHIFVHDAGSKWNNTGVGVNDDLIIGEHGKAKLEIRGGASVVSSNLHEIILGKNAGSIGQVVVDGATSRWKVNHPLVTVGQAGTGQITLTNNGVIEYDNGFPAPTIALGEDGLLNGTGAINGSILSFGNVMPGDDGGGSDSLHGVTTGQLTVNGDYEQVGPGIGGGAGALTGSLHVRVGGPSPGSGYDVLHVTGQAKFGGGLFVSLVNNYAPTSGAFQLVDAPNVTKSFDVAYLPSLTNKFLQLDSPFSDGIAGVGNVTITVVGLDTLLAFADDSFSVTGSPGSFAVGQLNNDSFDDLAITVSNGTGSNGSVLVLINDGTGQNFFVTPITVGIDPVAVTIGKFDANNNFDLAVVNRLDGVTTGTVSVLANNGSGSFSNLGSPITVGVRPSAIASANFDGISQAGGQIDFVVTNVGGVPGADGTVVVYTNTGAGAFNNGPLLPTGPNPIGVDPSDVDTDRDVDFIVLSAQAGSAGAYSNNGAGGFPTVVTYTVGNQPGDLAIGLLNGDALPDFVVANRTDGTVSVLMNIPGAPGTFAPAVNLPLNEPLNTADPRSLAIVDLDGDGDRDIAVLANEGATPKVQVLRNDTAAPVNSPLALALASSQTVGAGAVALASGNMDASTGQDLITINTGAPPPLNDGGGIAGGPDLTLLFNAASSTCLGDIAPLPVGNQAVNVDDLLAVINGWGLCQPAPAPCRADIAPSGGNGFVNVDDLLAVINHWGACP